MATFKPTRVLPAPGTPVTKHMAFLLLALASPIRLDIATDVRARFFSPASLLDKSATEWLQYNAVAASIIVGVGLYRPVTQFAGSIFLPSANKSVALMMLHI